MHNSNGAHELFTDDLIARIECLSRPMRQALFERLSQLMTTWRRRMASPVPGKRFGDNTYVHVEALSHLDGSAQVGALHAQTLAGIEAGTRYNLVRMHADGVTVTLLSYPRFFDDPFPSLHERWLVDFDSGSVSYRSYADALNPPNLHRKELLMPSEDPRHEQFAELTAAAEAIGLRNPGTRNPGTRTRNPGTQYRLALYSCHGMAGKSDRTWNPASHRLERKSSARGVFPGE